MLAGLGVFIAGLLLVTLRPSYPAFFATFILVMIGKYIFDPAMQAYIGDRVDRAIENLLSVLPETDAYYNLGLMYRGQRQYQEAAAIVIVLIALVMLLVGGLGVFPGAAIGDEVILLGRDGDLNVDATEHAKLTNTISYEVLCRIGDRVPRQYV